MTITEVQDKVAHQRLDIVVNNLFPQHSRSSIKKLIDAGEILVNGSKQKPGYRLRLKDKISIPGMLTDEEVIPEIDLPIIFEDDDVVVTYKPEGLLTHSKGVFNPEPTIATWLKSKAPNLTGDRPGIVHRLDRATSGVIIVAKNPEAKKWLQKQFSTRKVKKTYVAVVNGQISPPEAIIDMPIQRNPKAPATFRVGANGKPALTRYKTLKRGLNHSLIELSPETGRTHQLRVHLAKLGKPIVGDTLYAGSPSDRLYLHALSLELTLPNKQRKIFQTKLPSTFEDLVKDEQK